MRPVDVEAVFVAGLSSVLPEHVGTRTPKGRPDAYVRVTRAGGGGLNLVQESPRMLIECFAADSVTAFDLASRAFEYVDAQWGSPGVRPSSPVNFDDPDTGQSRYQFTVSPIVNLTEESA